MRRIIASSFGLGFVPRLVRGRDEGAGTFGALLGAGIGGSLLALDAPWWTGLVAAAVAIAASLWSAGPFTVDGEDPAWVCMDETAGTLVALVGLGGIPWVVALVVARLADIFKVLPGVEAAEGLHGTVGVTADDVVAGLYGLAIGWGLTGLGV
ncbi:MAG: phosphatidylglycerophosphatase A [Acidimicrobiia bacterium]|nr:phosphatidylglycerophosphatase A [Acidimicrobiia bacterium]